MADGTRQMGRRAVCLLPCVIACVVVALGWFFNTRVAGGSDSYGYVSQADLWLHGLPIVDQSFVSRAPWPLAAETFSPLGYRPDATGTALVPIYSPGLPMLMATAKTIAGMCGVFAIVPIAGGVLVLATYWIGRQLVGPLVGLASAWIVATSPTFLYMVVQPMSDVPAAAAWAVAIGGVIAGTTALAALSGVAAAIAILIRPNLVLIAAVLFIRAWTRRGLSAVAFAVPVALAVVVTAAINNRLHGSPLSSGYDLTGGFAWSYILPNLRNYGTWLLGAETPLAAAGLAYVAFVSPVMAVIAAVVWLSYLVYFPWDAWWYLRFLLPAWPAMAIGTAALMRRANHVGAIVIVALGVVGVWQAIHRGAFAIASEESRYVEVARVVESSTPTNAVVISAQHSGALRFYAGRMTLRWEMFDPAWLDRAVTWLAANGHHPFIVLDDAEVIAFRERFAQASAVGKLDWEPSVTFRAGTIAFYDALARDRRDVPIAQPSIRAMRECVPPRLWPVFR